MRWILPLLSLALVPSAFGEIAVYTGSLVVQNVSTPRSSIVRVADVIDLSTGTIVTVGLSGGKKDFSYVVGPEVSYVVAKTNDGKGHGLTAFAQASTDLDSAGSKFALAANLRGKDVSVTLSDAGASQWPRSLTGSGSLVAAAGNDPVATPASASFSTIALTLDVALSKVANAAGGTLSQAAEVIAQQYRNRVAAALKFTPVNTGVVAASTTTTGGITTTGGFTKTGAGTLVFGSTSMDLLGTVTLNGGTLQVTGAGLLNGPTPTPLSGSLVVTGAGSLTLSGTNAFNGGSLSGVIVNGVILNNPITPVLSTTAPIGTISGGTLTLNNNTGLTTTGATLLGGAGISTTATLGSGGAITLAGSSNLTLANSLPSTLNFPSSYTALTLTGGVPLSYLPVGTAVIGATSVTGFPIAGGDTLLTNSSVALTALLAANPNLAAYTLNGGSLTIVGASAAFTQTDAGTLLIMRSTGGTTTITASSIVPVTAAAASAETP